MSKILTTQLTGLLQRIGQSEEGAVEETARLLAQASIGQGIVYFAGFGEFEAVVHNALTSAEPFTNAARWTKDTVVEEADRVIIFTRNGNDAEAVALATQLNDAFIPFSAVASEVASAENALSELAYTYISLKMRGGILPHPTKLGERIVMPHLIAALYIYEAMKMEYDEMIHDEDDDEQDDVPASPFS